MKTKIFSFLLLIHLSGCAGDYTEVEKPQIAQSFALNSSPTFKGYYYEGSDRDFHYFSSRWQYGRDRYFKISTKDLSVDFPKSHDSDPILLSPLRQEELSKGFVKIRGAEIQPTPGRPRVITRGREFTLQQEQQMEAIRSGKLPPPVPLTREMELQLVAEGVLPPK